MSALSDLANKLAADIDTKLAAHRSELDAKDALIANMNERFTGLQAEMADMNAALATLQAADAKLTQP